MSPTNLATFRGSPPRRRGGLIGGVVWVSMLGLTPAQAGRTGRSRSAKSRAWAHPRAGGADLVSASMVASADGSPPRRRGGRPRSSSCVSPPAAHPRAGGADLYLRRLSILTEGSPPRRRGGQRGFGGEAHRRGLTPAQAGRTGAIGTDTRRTTAHPRAGGADQRLRERLALAEGSPPRRRGGLLDGPGRGGREGLTPAQAGRTWSRGSSWRWTRAHPRAGGADASCARRTTGHGGSPPRRRGGRCPASRRGPAAGLTPAQAGRTPKPTGSGSGGRAHPRAGGADVVGVRLDQRRTGSPPRRRGGPIRDDGRRRECRLTPAQAGRTEYDRLGRRWCPGSPPRRRGGRRARGGSGVDDGLTPAQAGRTAPVNSTAPGIRAHPRAGGAD